MGNKESQRNSIAIPQTPDPYLIDTCDFQDWAHFSFRNDMKYLSDFSCRILVRVKN